jgi:hypothetical protein
MATRRQRKHQRSAAPVPAEGRGPQPLLLVAIVRKRLTLEVSLYQILQILSVIPFEKTPLLQVLHATNGQSDLDGFSNQLILFNL